MNRDPDTDTVFASTGLVSLNTDSGMMGNRDKCKGVKWKRAEKVWVKKRRPKR